MAPRPPDAARIRELAAALGFSLRDGESEAYAALIAPTLEGFGAHDSLPDEFPAVRFPRTAGRRPEPDENPLGAWYVKTTIDGAASGPLQGRTVAVKDNVMVAGVPMMNGTSILEGYVPPVDATVVTRTLEAGATVLGKAVCEAYCFSGGSHTSATGPVRNPHDPARSAGGSSSGSAALVGSGEVDLAIGGDQGGSIRMPASFSGGVGMKPTHGLVPYTGILAIEPTVDHAGPITATVEDNARFLEVLAGPDGIDGRQAAPKTQVYSDALGEGMDGLRIGVLREGFGLASSEPDVDAAVSAAAQSFARLGAKVSETSVPLHAKAPALLYPVFASGIDTIFRTDGFGIGREDLFVPSFLDRHRGWRERADELPATVKMNLLLFEHVRRDHGYHYYAKAMNWIRRLRAAYDAALAEVDALLLPTTPMKATPLPKPAAELEEVVTRAFEPLANTQPFDHTHHPALSIPCAMSEGLPIGLMLVGRAYDEHTLYRAAHAFEQSGSWKTRTPETRFQSLSP